MERTRPTEPSQKTPSGQDSGARFDGLSKGAMPASEINNPQKPAGTAQVIQIPQRPWQSLSMDVLGPLPLSKGYRNHLVVVDRFSTAVRTAPLPYNYTTRDICDALIKHVYSFHGTPQEIITDRGTQFVSNFSMEMHKSFGVLLMPSTAFHQETNGSAERAIKSITQVLRNYVNTKQTDWVDHICCA